MSLLGREGSLAEYGETLRTHPDSATALLHAELRAPIPAPPSVRDYASFEQHIEITYAAVGRPVPPSWKEEPSAFFLNPTTIIGPGDTVSPPCAGAELDFEVEVAAVIGDPCRDLEAGEARDHIAGYMALNDWSARAIQRAEFSRGLNASKSKDWATSTGPWLVTPDDFDPDGAGAVVSVNGRRYGHGSLADMYWSFAELVAHASQGCWLRPGDVIASGTLPGGCLLELSASHGVDRYPWLQSGDTVDITIDNLGTLSSPICGPREPQRPHARWVERDRQRPVWRGGTGDEGATDEDVPCV